MKVALAGSATLTRFTEGILRDGLRACGCEVLSQENGADFGIIQIHGAPAAREADLEIIRNLPKAVSRLTGCIILLHRPDEISDTIPQLKSVLSALPATTGLAMLGDLLIDDPFYQLPQLSRRVIPHGFFDSDTDILSRPVIIGSHTTWGEMRSVKRTLALLKAIAKVGPRTPVIGYLGGTPAEALSRKSVSAHLEHFDLNKVFTLRDFKTEDWREEIQTATPNTIFLHAGAAAPSFDVTFNVQLYHYGERIRMGESSGSLHASAGIPVIFEMNGSERIENLKTIKVPYSNPNDADAADIDSAARQIATLLDTGEYSQMLIHNREMTRVWNNQSVARLYIDFLESLAQ
jgi:hypothetical protein